MWFKHKSGLEDAVIPLKRDSRNHDALLEDIGERPVVLIGEASHGTEEFYRMRADITRQLILKKGFHAVAVEGDWAASYEINRYVRGRGNDSPQWPLEAFLHFPRWVWRNEAVVDFMRWLRAHNDGMERAHQAGFYGLDLYCLFSCARIVIDYLEMVDPTAARQARERYSCFEQYDPHAQRYGYAVAMNLSESCEKEVVRQLIEVLKLGEEKMLKEDDEAAEKHFNAECSALAARNAEAYYRALLEPGVNTWNLRDRHMVKILFRIREYLRRWHEQPKVVVWAHNSHIGNANATEAGQKRGELNIGSLCHEAYRDQSYRIGFTTYDGSVTAASDWDAPMEHKTVREALPESYEALFHSCAHDDFLLLLKNRERLPESVKEVRLQRAIGVIYRPETERASHYYQADISHQFDALIHLDRTKALKPLDPYHTVGRKSASPMMNSA